MILLYVRWLDKATTTKKSSNNLFWFIKDTVVCCIIENMKNPENRNNICHSPKMTTFNICPAMSHLSAWQLCLKILWSFSPNTPNFSQTQMNRGSSSQQAVCLSSRGVPAVLAGVGMMWMLCSRCSIHRVPPISSGSTASNSNYSKNPLCGS